MGKPGGELGSEATQQARENVRRVAEGLEDWEVAAHLTLALNSILRRLDAIEERLGRLEA